MDLLQLVSAPSLRVFQDNYLSASTGQAIPSTIPQPIHVWEVPLYSLDRIAEFCVADWSLLFFVPKHRDQWITRIIGLTTGDEVNPLIIGCVELMGQNKTGVLEDFL